MVTPTNLQMIAFLFTNKLLGNDLWNDSDLNCVSIGLF